MAFRYRVSRNIINFFSVLGGLLLLTSSAFAHVRDLTSLYSAESHGFHYALPREVLESFVDGKAFDHKQSYTPEERKALEADIDAIFTKVMASAKKSASPLAVLTAGSPGTGKTTLMRQAMQLQKKGVAYICPDDVCLKNMTSTYLTEVVDGEGKLQRSSFASNDDALAARRNLRQELYNKWRPGSNAAAHLILGYLIREKYDFYFGTTSSSPASVNLFQLLKKEGYKIKLLHISAPDDVRWGSIQERDKTFVQTTEIDTIEKGILVPQRILDTYLKFADEIEFYYRAKVKEDALLAATWKRETTSGKPVLTILRPESYAEIVKIHDAVCKKLNRSDLLWKAAVEENSLVRMRRLPIAPEKNQLQ